MRHEPCTARWSDYDPDKEPRSLGQFLPQALFADTPARSRQENLFRLGTRERRQRMVHMALLECSVAAEELGVGLAQTPSRGGVGGSFRVGKGGEECGLIRLSDMVAQSLDFFGSDTCRGGNVLQPF